MPPEVRTSFLTPTLILVMLKKRSGGSHTLQRLR